MEMIKLTICIFLAMIAQSVVTHYWFKYSERWSFILWNKYNDMVYGGKDSVTRMREILGFVPTVEFFCITIRSNHFNERGYDGGRNYHLFRIKGKFKKGNPYALKPSI